MKMKKVVWITGFVIFGALAAQADVLFLEEFDGNNKGYNVNSATAVSGGDWVDFGNRIAASDIGTSIEGYTTAGTGESVLAGASGAGQNDPQIRSDFSIGFADAGDITSISVRIRVDLNDNGIFDDTLAESNVDLAFGNATYVVPKAGNTANAGNQNFDGLAGFTSTKIDEANGWTIFSYTCEVDRLGSMRSLRLDPINNNPGTSYEVDYISIQGIPEPSTLGLVGIAGMGLLLVRRRFRR
mgnify:CR=1 FL=1